MFEVILSPDARTFYARADQPLARKLARCFALLERDPRRHNNIKRLSGDFVGRLRYRDRPGTRNAPSGNVTLE